MLEENARNLNNNLEWGRSWGLTSNPEVVKHKGDNLGYVFNDVKTSVL